MIKKIIDAHKFFVEQTPKFIGSDLYYDWTWYGLPENTGVFKLTTKQKLYYPIAYIKFMYYCLKD